ncbi:hypothetical protein FOL47_003184, partial [Perkinsus chesapeaki]
VFRRIKDKDSYSKALQSGLKDWESQLSPYMSKANIEDAVTKLALLMKSVKEAHCSSSKLLVRAGSPPWWGENLDRLRKQVRKAQRRSTMTKSTADWDNYKKLRNAYNKTIKRYKSEWFYKSISEEKEYGKILRYRKPRNVDDSQPGLDVFVHHTPYQDDDGVCRMVMTLDDVQMAISEVEDAMQRAWSYILKKKDTASGLDDLRYSDIRSGGIKLWNGLTMILKAMIAGSYFPEYGKDSRMIFLPKGKNHGTPDGFRPICMSSCITKCLELGLVEVVRAFEKRVSPLSLVGTHLLSSHGYALGRSTATAVNEVVSGISDMKHDHSCVAVLSVDMKGAFNGASHVSICDAVRSITGSSALANVVGGYLHGRRCHYKGKIRRCMTKGGTPQGGVLSPVIYRLFHTKVMNIPQTAVRDGILVRVVSYADDMIILVAAEDENDLAQAIRDIVSALE